MGFLFVYDVTNQNESWKVLKKYIEHIEKKEMTRSKEKNAHKFKQYKAKKMIIGNKSDKILGSTTKNDPIRAYARKK